jgi:hypothetical protein
VYLCESVCICIHIDTVLRHIPSVIRLDLFDIYHIESTASKLPKSKAKALPDTESHSLELYDILPSLNHGYLLPLE